MPVAELMLTGFELLLLGMGIVFGFLTLLVFTLHAMSRFAAALDRRSAAALAASGAAVTPSRPEPAGQETLIAVITAAVTRYRASRDR